MDWLETWKEVCSEEDLNNWTQISYLGSNVAMPETRLDQTVESNSLIKWLKQADLNGDHDYFDLFLAEKADEKKIFVVLSPADLWDDETLFKVYPANQEDFESFPDFEIIYPEK